MKKGDFNREPMCETSERGEKILSRDEMLPLALEIGRRLIEVFGYHGISNIVFRLRSNSDEINSIINGEILPSTELLLGMHKVTGVSIDWLLTGKGARYSIPLQIQEASYDRLPSALWFINQDDDRHHENLVSCSNG